MRELDDNREAYLEETTLPLQPEHRQQRPPVAKNQAASWTSA